MARKNKEEWKVRENVFDNYTLRLLFNLESSGHIKGLRSSIALGKEANIFTAESKTGDLVIAKIYRLEACNFNKMYDYIKQDPRYLSMGNSRRKTIFAWAQREFRNLMKAREAIRVPTPIIQKDHIIIMEMIGNNEPAKMLKDKHPENNEHFFNEIIQNIEKLWNKSKLVHGDLSEFNILNHNEQPVFIDFSQATPTKSPHAKELLERDIKNICRFFKKTGLKKDPENIINELNIEAC